MAQEANKLLPNDLPLWLWIRRCLHGEIELIEEIDLIEEEKGGWIIHLLPKTLLLHEIRCRYKAGIAVTGRSEQQQENLSWLAKVASRRMKRGSFFKKKKNTSIAHGKDVVLDGEGGQVAPSRTADEGEGVEGQSSAHHLAAKCDCAEDQGMFFWHWTQITTKKRETGARCVHGLQLRPRWNGVGAHPVCAAPPASGLLALEMNHPFHFKLSPAMMLGPRCNHDLGVLLRFPIHTTTNDSGVNSPESESAWNDATRNMVDGMVAREFYCSDYSTKEQPHIEGLLQTLLNGVRNLDQDIAAKIQSGETMLPLERAKRCLNRLISSTNRRMHKGYPEMLSYLMGKPAYYCSHNFRSLVFEYSYRAALAIVHKLSSKSPLETVIRQEVPRNNAIPKGTNIANDYIFRPAQLEEFSWYFMVAACDAAAHHEQEILQWSCYDDVRHPCYEQGPLVMSKILACPLKKSGKNLHYYRYYPKLRTTEAWFVPTLYGRMPKKPVADADPEEKGKYALFVMLLFRPWRGVHVPDFLGDVLYSSSGMPLHVAWHKIHDEFIRWRRDDIDKVAQPYLQRASPIEAQPPYNSRDWWACMTALRLRNLDISLRQDAAEKPSATPSDLSLLPKVDDAYEVPERQNQKHVPDDDGGDSDDSRLPSDPLCGGDAAAEDVDRSGNDKGRRSFPTNMFNAALAGVLPLGVQLHDLISWPHSRRKGQRIGPEEQFLASYADTLQNAFTARDTQPRFVMTAGDADNDFEVSAADAVSAHESQVKFLKDVDEYKADSENKPVPSASTTQGSPSQGWVKQLQAFTTQLPTVTPSETIVIEVACQFVQSGLLNIPDTGHINVKAARAFLSIAQRLQEYMLFVWATNGDLNVEDVHKIREKTAGARYHRCRC